MPGLGESLLRSVLDTDSPEEGVGIQASLAARRQSEAPTRARTPKDLLLGRLTDPFGINAPVADLAGGAISAVGSAFRGYSAISMQGEDGYLNRIGEALQGGADLLDDYSSSNLAMQYTGKSIIQALGTTAPILAAGFAHPELAYGLSGLISAGEAADRARKAGLSDGEVATAAIAGGITGSLTERMFGAPGKIVHRLSDSAVKPGLKGAIQFLERIWDKGALLKEAGGEGLEEALQGFTQDVIQRAYDPNQDVFSYDAAIRRLSEFGLGAAAGGIMSGVSTVAQDAALREMDQAAKTERLIEAFRDEGVGVVRADPTPALMSDEEVSALGGVNDPDSTPAYTDGTTPAEPSIGFSPSAEESNPILQIRGGMELESQMPTLPSLRNRASAQQYVAGIDPKSENRNERLQKATDAVVLDLTEGLKLRRGLKRTTASDFPVYNIPDSLEGTDVGAFLRGTAEKVDRFNYYWQIPPRFFEMVDGWQKNGNFTKFFWHRAVNGWYNHKKLYNTDALMLKKFYDDTGKELGPHWLAEATDAKMILPSGKELTGGDAMGIAMATQDFLADKVIADDGVLKPDESAIGKMTQEDIQFVRENLTDAQKKMIAYARGYFNNKHPQIAAVFERLTGKTMPFVDGYFPVWRTGEQGADTLIDLEQQMRALGQEGVADKLKKTMTKAREVSEAGDVQEAPIVVDLPTVLERYMQTANYYIAMAEALDDFRRVAKNPILQEKLGKAMGRGKRAYGDKTGHPVDAGQFLNGWIEALARPGPATEADSTARLFRWLRVHGAVGVLGLKLGIGLKQSVSGSIAIAEYGDSRAIMSGFIKVGKALATEGFDNSEIRRAEQIAPDVFHRTIERDVEEYKMLAAGRKSGKWGRRFQKFDQASMNIAMKLITTIDKWTVASIFLGVYDTEIKTKSHQEAAAIARRINMLTQPQSTPMDLSPFFRGGEIAKTLSTFTNQINKNQNMDRAMYNRVRNGEVSKADFAAYSMFRYMIPGTIMAIINHAFNPDWEDIGEEMIKQPVAGLPGIGSMVNSLIYLHDRGGLGYGQSASNILFPTPLAVSGLGRAGTAGFRIAGKLGKGDTPSSKDIGNLVGGGLSAVGVPGDAIRAMIAAGAEYSNNPAMNPLEFVRAMLFTPYQRRRGPIFGEPAPKSSSGKPKSLRDSVNKAGQSGIRQSLLGNQLLREGLKR